VPGVKVELLHHAPRPATVAAAVTLPAANRSAAVLSFLDSLAKASGELGRLPGEAVRELETKTKTPITLGMIDRTKGVTVVLPARQELPKGASPLPMLVLHCEAAEVATAWEGFVPKLIGDLANTAPPPPSSETINGVKVFSLPWKGAVHYASKGATFAVGLDRRLVAQAVIGEPGGSVAGGDKAVTAPADAVVLLGSVALGDLIRAVSEPRTAEGPVVPVPNPIPTQPGMGGQLPPEKLVADMAKARQEFFAAFDSLPPATLTARREGHELRIELFQPKVQGGGLSPIVTAAVGWFDKVQDLSNPQSGSMPYSGRNRRLGGIEMNWGKPGEP
jgi:hypothetical protein